jgi:uncharacterized membrane protein YfcA
MANLMAIFGFENEQFMITEIAIIALVACLASMLTFFSGFGLGTILTPVFIIFFPVELAVALSGIVHLLNNMFKITLTFKNITYTTGLKFGLPAIAGSFIGAQLLFFMVDIPVIHSYTLHHRVFEITPVKLVMALLMLFFALFEIIPALKKLQFDKNKLYIGGLVSGFFGGLTGNQGALRSAFLLRTGLSKEGFIATGIFIACLVDCTRIPIYLRNLNRSPVEDNLVVLSIAVLAAFLGAFVGSKLLKKIQLGFIHWMVAIMIFILSLALGAGLL